MRYVNSCFWLASGALLAACAHSSSSSPTETKFVKYATTIPPIVVPRGAHNPTGESYYPIPPVTSNAALGVKPPLTPPGSSLVNK